jgi:hydrogenase 3 maturation protease
MTLNSTWQNPLRDLLASRRHDPLRSPRLAIVGIGNELCADDAAGVLVVRQLSMGRVNHPACLAIEAGTAPENVTGSLRQFKPEVVLFVDAADMGGPPGAVRWVGMDEIDGLSASTHSLPLSMYARYLAAELGCAVGLLGIQPASTQMGDTVSACVRDSVRAVAEGILGEAVPAAAC